MPTLYLTEQGAVLHKTGNRLVITKKKATLLEVPCHEVDAVLVFGNVHFTTPAVRELSEHGIEMAFLTTRGRLLCQLTPPISRNITLRMAQYDRVRDDDFCLGFARAVVGAKLQNCARLVRQYAYNHPAASLTSELEAITRDLARLEAAPTASVLFGIEGSAARTYFAALRKMVPDTLGFTGRRKRPPRDPVNALLSFGYSLLTSEIASMLDGIGFDPHLGLYHRMAYGRPSLAADLIEEFRAAAIDRLTLRLLNKKILTGDDFYTASNGGVYLKREALRRYLREYEKAVGEVASQLDAPTAGSPGSPRSVRELVRGQCRLLQEAIVTAGAYRPFELEI